LIKIKVLKLKNLKTFCINVE